MQVEVPEPPPDAAARIDALLARYEAEALGRADRLVRFAETKTCRHRQVAEHFGEAFEGDCGMCDVCSPLAATDAEEPAAAPLPEDIAGAIHTAVRELRWPLGRTGLIAMLRGSMSAPRSAQRSPHFGLLAAAGQSDVKRWLQLLEVAGALEPFESEDGFRLLRAVALEEIPAAGLPRIGAAAAATPDERLFERLRAWRLERARSDEVPAYVVLHDATLRELAAVKPSSHHDLAGVKGFGPAKLERYAADVLAVISASAG
jgi:ATP-dependent DNA helicase RecQ